MSLAITQIEKIFGVSVYTIEAMLERVAFCCPYVSLRGKGVGDILQHLVSHGQLLAAPSAEMVSDFVPGNADGPWGEIFARRRERMALKERDGDILKDVLSVSTISHR